MSLREHIENYVRRVKELADHVKGNEQATKQSLIGPFFTMLGYDLTDPRECIPEYRADFGKERSSKPIDWAFQNNSGFAFFVEAKEVGKKLGGFDEQLADYFAKEPSVRLGILTNGAQWRFFTDVVNANALKEWARQHVLTSVLAAPSSVPGTERVEAQKIETTPEELEAFATIQRLLGVECPVAYEDSVAYFKVHLADKRTKVFTRLQIGKRQTNVWVPLPQERTVALAGGRPVTAQGGWSIVALDPGASVDGLGELFKAAHQQVGLAKGAAAPADD